MPALAALTHAPYPFLPAEGEGLHQIPVGPVHAGIIEPGHFRFTANGETVVRLEERLGYVHKGIDALMAGASLERARAAGRPRLGRQHGRVRSRLVHGSRGCARARRFRRARYGCGRSRRARAAGQSLRRHRRRVQRRVVQHHARELRPAARAGAARVARLLRPPPDDGPRHSRRHALRPDRPMARRVGRAGRHSSAGAFRSSSTCTKTPPRSRTAPSTPASFRPRSRSNSLPAATSAALQAAVSMRGARRAMRRTTSCASRCRRSRPATSTRASGFASRRWSRASRSSSRSSRGCPPGPVCNPGSAAAGRGRGAGRRLSRRHFCLGAHRR